MIGGEISKLEKWSRTKSPEHKLEELRKQRDKLNEEIRALEETIRQKWDEMYQSEMYQSEVFQTSPKKPWDRPKVWF